MPESNSSPNLPQKYPLSPIRFDSSIPFGHEAQQWKLDRGAINELVDRGSLNSMSHLLVVLYSGKTPEYLASYLDPDSLASRQGASGLCMGNLELKRRENQEHMDHPVLAVNVDHGLPWANETLRHELRHTKQNLEKPPLYDPRRAMKIEKKIRLLGWASAGLCADSCIQMIGGNSEHHSGFSIYLAGVAAAGLARFAHNMRGLAQRQLLLHSLSPREWTAERFAKKHKEVNPLVEDTARRQLLYT